MLQNVAFASELKSPLLINSLQLKPQTSYQIPREFVGFIQAKQQTSLGSELNGKVKRILVDVGKKCYGRHTTSRTRYRPVTNRKAATICPAATVSGAIRSY